ncbi:transposase [Streptomyces sp. NPDC001139]
MLDVDASFVPAHCGKEGAEPHRKGFGLHPLLVCFDNTDKYRVCRLRPGSAGANTASDPIDVSPEAVRQLPTRRRRKILFRADGAGVTKEWHAWITTGGGNKAHTCAYSNGWSRDKDFWTGPAKVPEKAWTPALDACEPSSGAPVHPKYTMDLKPFQVATGSVVTAWDRIQTLPEPGCPPHHRPNAPEVRDETRNALGEWTPTVTTCGTQA